jgi:endoglucanase
MKSLRTLFQASTTIVGAFALAAASCIPKKAPGSAAGAENTVEGKKCGPDGVMDDGEDNNNQASVQKGRSGYWYTFLDKVGSTISPEGGGTFAMAQGGANGSAYSARMTGKVGTGEVVYAGMGLNFVDPKNQYDASAYKGISFWAKRGAGTGKVRLKVPDANTDQDGKVCTECFNDFGTDLELTETWTQYVIPFSQMKQLSGWGAPHPPAIDTKKLYGVQFQVNQPGASFDVWVDDLQFTGCP